MLSCQWGVKSSLRELEFLETKIFPFEMSGESLHTETWLLTACLQKLMETLRKKLLLVHNRLSLSVRSRIRKEIIYRSSRTTAGAAFRGQRASGALLESLGPCWRAHTATRVPVRMEIKEEKPDRRNLPSALVGADQKWCNVSDQQAKLLRSRKQSSQPHTPRVQVPCRNDHRNSIRTWGTFPSACWHQTDMYKCPCCTWQDSKWARAWVSVKVQDPRPLVRLVIWGWPSACASRYLGCSQGTPLNI